MTETIKKSVLCDYVSRHSSFDFNACSAGTLDEDYVIWNGYCLPMHYTNARDEYVAIRNSCAMFDVSPMKKYRFRGTDAGAFLDRILTAPVSQLAANKAAYGLLCDEQGLLVDDGIVTKFTDQDYLLFVSEIDLDAHFASYNDFADLAITEETPSLAGLALQGPKSCAILDQFGFKDIACLEPFTIEIFDLDGHEILVGRLGFTGDLGYEIWFPPAAIEAVTSAIARAEVALAIQVPGYALSALQVCRIEAGMIVPGWDTAGEFVDLARERTPYELTLGWNVKLQREESFAGKQALTRCKAQGARFRMRGIRIDTAAELADGQPLFAEIGGRTIQIGSLPSITWHSADEEWIGFASVEAAHRDVEAVFVLDGEARLSGRFYKLPFIKLERASQMPAPL